MPETKDQPAHQVKDKVDHKTAIPVQDQDLLTFLVDDQMLKALWTRSVEAQALVVKVISAKPQADHLLDQIQLARNLVMEHREKFDEADRLIADVEHAIQARVKVLSGSRKVAPWLFGYELAWLVVLGWLTFALSYTPTLLPVAPTGIINVSQLVASLCWGGMGGVVGAIFALWKHVAVDQDFDSQYSMWYITNPVLGIALGGFVFLVIQAGFLSLTASTTGGNAIQSALVIYVLAWVCGFKQNVVYEIVRRILDVFKVDTTSKAKPEEKSGAGDSAGVG